MINRRNGSKNHHFELEPTDDVKPCPFCGSRDLELQNTHTPSYRIECQSCPATISGEYGPDLVGGRYGSERQHRASAESAVAAWNRRDGAA